MDERQRAEFARRVRDARASRGWNQVDLAEAAGVAPNTIVSIETGKRSPQPQSVAAVMAALDLEPQAGPEVPADVELVSRVVTMWLMGIAAEDRPAAVLDLMQFLRTPAPAAEASVVAEERPVRVSRTRVAGRSAKSSPRTGADVGPGV